MRIIESPSSSSSSASSSDNDDEDERMSDEDVLSDNDVDISQASVIVISPPPRRNHPFRVRPPPAAPPRRPTARMVDVVERIDLDDSRLDDPNNVTYRRDSFVVDDDEDSDDSGSSDGSIADSFDNSLDNRTVNVPGEFLVDRVMNAFGDDDDEEEEEAPSEPAGDLNASMPPDVIRSSEHGHCSICFEEAPYDPMGCLICRQLIGCKRCVTKWYEAGKKKAARREENADNHFMCPLCRHKWEGAPEVDSIFLLDS